MGDSMRIAAAQMCGGADKRRNIADAIALIERAARAGAELVVLPETWSYMGSADGVLASAETIPGDTTCHLAETARSLGIYLHCGSIHERVDREPRAYNTTVVLNPDGDIIGAYRKIHLFDVSIGDEVVSRESATIAPGDDVVLVDVDGVKLGLTICYDLRYPELFRMLALDGAQIIAVPSAFHQHTGRDHWEVLLRARAIENQVFVVAANAHGRHPSGWLSYGRSMIVDPWGTVLSTAPDGAGVIVWECDLQQIERIRQELPSLENRRPSAYRWSLDAALVP
ncbi:MAG TPA: carbon-nitrogen hydrolase family protein [Thermomicrobiales bacterium]|nr:carbon-nitrogen hydrolase family protein [Thermomicrobiales bacterium]